MADKSERVLTGIWADVLGCTSVAPDANFFEVGGDSLKAIEVITRVGESLEVELPLIAFFEEPTISHLATVIDELIGSGAGSRLGRASVRSEFPLSYSQQMFWLLEQQTPDSGLYNSQYIFRIRGQVDGAVLERSLGELCRRHEILRVRFIQGTSGPVQVVDAAGPFSLQTTDLSTLDADQQGRRADALVREVIRTPFNLRSGPVLRSHLVHLSADEYLLCLVMHHVVSDGFSGGIVLEELSLIYEAFVDGKPSPLPEPELHFTDYATWEQQSQSGFDREKQYWQTALKGVPPSLNVPTDVSRDGEPNHLGRQRSMLLPPNVFDSTRSLAQVNGATLFTVLAAVLRILLWRWSGQHDFLLGTVASNRSRGGVERMIGCFVNPLPLRNAISDYQSVQSVIECEKVANLDAFANQHCPFAKIVEAVNPPRTANENPLFNVAFLLQNFPAISLSGHSFEAELIGVDAETALLDLRFIATETRFGLRVTCEYKPKLFADHTVDALLRAYCELLEAVSSRPHMLAAEIALPEVLSRQAQAARKREHNPTITITASFTAQSVEEPLNYLLQELGMEYRIEFAPYQQVFQQLLDPKSVTRSCDGFGILLLRAEDWLHAHDNDSSASERLDQLAGELIDAVKGAEKGAAPLIVCFCPASQTAIERAGSLAPFDRLESRVAAALSSIQRLSVIRSRDVLRLYPVDHFEDEYTRRLGNVPYTTDFFSALASVLARSMWNIAENRYKVIALEARDILRQDADSQPNYVLLDALAAQRDVGMLLTLCTGGAEESVWSAFSNHPSAPLQRDDFVAAEFNVQSYSDALRSLAAELAIDLDAFIFVHVDSSVGAAVELACPEVLTLQVPTDSANMSTWLNHVWAFDRAGMSRTQDRHELHGHAFAV